ncbi:MAG: glycosyltransferase family 2 protein, partial [Desulfurococcaceae archaeon]
LREQGINTWILWRSIPRGFRTGALNDGLNASIGDYIYIIDVDTRPEKLLIDKAICILRYDQRIVGVIGRWEPLNQDTRVSQALGLGLRFLAGILYRARSRCDFFIYPLGTGTVYNATILKNTLHGWDERRIQDDMEIGARILSKGLQTLYLDDVAVYVENPGTYRSFRIQQSRWAYGALDTAISRFKEIINSQSPLMKKLEALKYLFQYITQALVFIGSLTLGILSLTSVKEPYYSIYMFLAWLLLMCSYGVLMYRIGYQGSSRWEFMVLSGRLTALSTAIAPYVTFSTLKAMVRIKEVYKRTPKGIYQKTSRSLRVPWELIYGLFFLFTGLIAFINEMIVTHIWLLMNSLCFFYIVYRFPREVFYE